MIAIQPVQFSVGVVDRGVEGADRDERAELGNRLGEFLRGGKLGGGSEVSRLQRHVQLDRMAELLVVGGELRDALAQRLHRGQRVRVFQHVRRPRPHIAQRHRAEAVRNLAGAVVQRAVDIEQRHAVEHVAAELDRRAVEKVLIGNLQFVHDDVARIRNRRAGAEAKAGHERACGGERLREFTACPMIHSCSFF